MASPIQLGERMINRLIGGDMSARDWGIELFRSLLVVQRPRNGDRGSGHGAGGLNDSFIGNAGILPYSSPYLMQGLNDSLHRFLHRAAVGCQNLAGPSAAVAGLGRVTQPSLGSLRKLIGIFHLNRATT